MTRTVGDILKQRLTPDEADFVQRAIDDGQREAYRLGIRNALFEADVAVYGVTFEKDGERIDPRTVAPSDSAE